MKKKPYRILLTHTNILQNDPKQVRKMKPYPPLATIQTAALLRCQGFDVQLYDSTFDINLDKFNKSLEEFNPDVLIVYEDYFNFIIKMCLSQMRKVSQLLCHAAKTIGITTIVASPDTTDNPLEYLKNGADYVIFGEPDATVLEVCQHLATGENPLKQKTKGIAGISTDNQLEITETRTNFHNSELLPIPAWDMINIEPYRKAWLENHGYFSLNIVSSKGCPYCCSWCAKPIWGNNYIQISVQQVVKEILWLKKHYNPDHLWFVDDLFGYNKSWVKNFTDSVRETNISIKYTIQTRADHLNQKIISLLKQSGCYQVWIGAESGSQKILDSMNKKMKLDAIKTAVAQLKSAEIRVGLFIQFGYLGETIEDIHATADLIRETFPNEIGISVTYPLPGTDLYHFVKADMDKKTNWKHSDDLSMLFNGTYTTPFYRKLRDILHSELDLMHLLSEDENMDYCEKDKLVNQIKEEWKILNDMEQTHRQTVYSEERGIKNNV